MGISRQYYAFIISIHAAQEGCDQQADMGKQLYRYFNPRSPRGLRQAEFAQNRATLQVISIHAAQEGCDRNLWQTLTFNGISIHAAQEGCD